MSQFNTSNLRISQNLKASNSSVEIKLETYAQIKKAINDS